MTICTYNARTLASEASVEDLMMQARKIKYDVIGLTETRRHPPLHAAYDSGEELFLGTCDSRGVGGVGVLVNTHLAMNIDSGSPRVDATPRLQLPSESLTFTLSRVPFHLFISLHPQWFDRHNVHLPRFFSVFANVIGALTKFFVYKFGHSIEEELQQRLPATCGRRATRYI
ncbi:unnamed protein product [Heligmosomoides polygyrus]|uniref:Endo/exonuclease/phosphatase domain-containing protein n=1 Tax=Heligmosomoides polygyrus TaxID=6339 RepID=A0A183FQM7_HELPZ|nr:unnamed protein product [Heligmosomoides polygyrus]